MGSGLTFDDKQLQQFLTHFTLPEKQQLANRSKKKKVIVIAGPTAVGKSQLGLIIAKAVGGQIISADSMQIYRGMDIGTSKPSLLDRQQVPHHLIDSRDLDETFNVVEYYKEASQAMKEIFDKGAIPIVVGGSGFYIHALLYGPPLGPPADIKLRKMLEEEMDSKGSAVLYEKLQQLDPAYALTITPNDRYKIVRALEIISLTNQKVSDFSPSVGTFDPPYDFRCWFIYTSKEFLYPKIEMRCDKMIADGLLDEVKLLEKQGLRDNPIAAKAIGYSDFLEFFSTKQTQEDFDACVDLFKKRSRHYAKRQFTWFRKEPLFRWFNIEGLLMERVAEVLIQDLERSL